MQERRLEVNAAERVIISADGAKTFRSCDRTPDHIATAGARLLRPDEHIKNYVSSIARLHYTNATSDQNTRGYKIPQVSKTKMGIIKTVTLQWKHFEKKPRVVRSSSISHRHSSADRLPRRSLDPQTAVLFQGETESNDLDCSAKEGELRLVKSNHYRRVVVLGAPRVGKTAILRRFLTGGFEQRYVPTTEDFYSKLYHIRGEAYQIDLLDASKERDYPAKRRLSILTGDIFLLVFSMDDKESFNEVCSLRDEIIAAKSKLTKSKETRQIPIIICGNKTDLSSERAVSQSELRECLGRDSALFEVSAKDATNLEGLFEALAELGGLPTETRPSLHRDISIRSYQALRNAIRSRRETRAHALDGPCGAVHPLARRPSFNSDLRRVIGPTTPKRSRPIDKCQIQ
ncbi:GTP-binding protein Rhes isoform X1 [Brachyhypopomus gauderio]|uniref:GTP-binding protein Rhes isoform X1 n=1 Tax=Brachyhypopomus gauderio TaxID=698409 RepID=UPI004043583A